MPRTLLVGIDGATFDVIDTLLAEQAMPHLARLITGGVRATLRSTIPALTPPAWTSLTTGRGPGAHGIFDFFRREERSSLLVRFLTSADVECPAVWTLASEQHLRSTVLNFPLTFPPPKINGHVVPGGFMPWRQMRLGCHPAGLFDRLKSLPGFNARELALDMTHEAKAIEGCDESEYEPWLDMHIRRERQWVSIARDLMETDPADFLAVMFDGVDKIQHLCWRFIDPRMVDALSTEWELRVRDKCREYFVELDHRIGELLEIAGADATVCVASDHGFGPQVRTLFLNAWLKDTGRLFWNEGQAPAAPGASTLGLNQMARHVHQMDWTRTLAYAPLPSGNGIHIVRESETHPHGVRDAEYTSFRDRLMADLLTIRDPQTGEAVVQGVWTREQLFRGPKFDVAPDLTLELTDGGLISILDSPEPVRRRPQPTGTHHPNGIFALAGPGVCAGVTLSPRSILDVAPVLMHALDLPIPSAFEGQFPTAAYATEYLDAHPLRSSSDAAVAATPAETVLLDAEAETEILQRLQALGYVD